MKRFRILSILFLGSLAVGVSLAQPPGRGGARVPAPYELGRLFPPQLRERLQLTQEQEKELAELEKQVKAKLEAILTEEQKKTLKESAAPMGSGPAPKGGRGGTIPAEQGPDPAAIKTGPRLTTHGRLAIVGDAKFPFAIRGDAIEGLLGDSRLEHNGGGVRFFSAEDRNNDGKIEGVATCTIAGISQEKGRWYRVRVIGLAQEDFAVAKDDLFIKVEFFKGSGTNSLDFIKKPFYPQVEAERKSLADAGTNKNLGPATWRTYSIDVRTPFPEVDTLNVSVGFAGGSGKGKKSEFWLAEVDVAPVPDPADYAAPAKPATDRAPPALKSLVKLGGKWYFDPRGGDATPPKQFDHTNADRLYYLTDRLETPFVGNMSAWLRRGNLDLAGKSVEKDLFIEDAMAITFTDKHLVMKSKNLPNHPISVFPDRSRNIDGNPNVVREQRDVWYIPLVPKANPDGPAAMTMQNKRGLPMGPIGVAVNGVVFFNPFDHIEDADAVWRVDRCCGHPSPTSAYHYHKYPVCVNTPWADDGTNHSPLIGFAFDGFPVFGPYEGKGLLAKDSKENPLNEFNLHSDDVRGPHYHVTPGKFPHIIGGYWGEADALNRGKKGPRN